MEGKAPDRRHMIVIPCRPARKMDSSPRRNNPLLRLASGFGLLPCGFHGRVHGQHIVHTMVPAPQKHFNNFDTRPTTVIGGDKTEIAAVFQHIQKGSECRFCGFLFFKTVAATPNNFLVFRFKQLENYRWGYGLCGQTVQA